ncbi:MFS transporter [Candidatus Solirubrobacter pratensis]|uniref:MFS transporter n=1 Tax=Candidatus Solirubrobacter pratensis TaxID=1298857 RepID=UPI0003FCCCCC|nr:MFS transporter [Candidatus Solirubrobacter pratensis]
MSRYGEILRSPQVGPLVASALLSRLPIGINALAIVLYLSQRTGSFAIAGAVAGSVAAGSGVGAPVTGRLVDRLGPRRVLVPLALMHGAALGAIVACAEAGLPAVVLIACGLLAGAAMPPTMSVLRSMWGDLVDPRLRQAAYALDSTLVELIFITGPLLTAAITALASPAAALIVSPAAALAGNAIFSALPATRAIQPEPAREGASRLGALASPGVRTIVLISLPAGIAIGICEVGIPGFSRHEGAPAAAGVLLAMWSLGSGAGGLVYGLLPRRTGLRRMHLLVAGLLPLSIAPLAAATSVAVMALLVIPAGCTIAPLLATRNELVASVAPEGSRTEAYSWPMTAFVGGIAIGSAVAGALIEGPGWRTAFLTATAIGVAGFLLAVARRATLVRTRVRVRTL